MISEHPEVNAIAGLNEYSAVGAARAVKDLGMEDQIVMVGFDSSNEEIQLLEAGIFEGIVIQKPFNMGVFVRAEGGGSVPQQRSGAHGGLRLCGSDKGEHVY